MNHTKRYLIKTFLAVFRNVIIRPDARKAPCDLPASDQSEQPILQHIKPLVSEQASQQMPPSWFNLQHLQVGEAAKGPVGDEADAVASDVELLQQAEAGEAGLLQSG